MILINEEQANKGQMEALEKHAKKLMGDQRWPKGAVTFRVGQNYRTVDVNGKEQVSERLTFRTTTTVTIPSLGLYSAPLRYAENINSISTPQGMITKAMPESIEIINGKKSVHAQMHKDLLIFLILHEHYGEKKKFYIPNTQKVAEKEAVQFEIETRFNNLLLGGLTLQDMRILLNNIPGHEQMDKNECIRELRAIYGNQPIKLIKMVEEEKLDSLTFIQKAIINDLIRYNGKDKVFHFTDSKDAFFKAKGDYAKDEFNEFLRKPQNEKYYDELKRVVIAHEKGLNSKDELKEEEVNLSKSEDADENPFPGMKSIDIPKDQKKWDGWSQDLADSIREDAKKAKIKSYHLRQIDDVLADLLAYNASAE